MKTGIELVTECLASLDVIAGLIGRMVITTGVVGLFVEILKILRLTKRDLVVWWANNTASEVPWFSRLFLPVAFVSLFIEQTKARVLGYETKLNYN